MRISYLYRHRPHTVCQSPNRFGRVDLVHGLALCCSQRIKHVQPQPSQLGSVSTDSRLGPWASRQTVTSSCQIRHDHVTWFTSQATDSHNHNHQPTRSPLISLDSGFFPCLTLEQHRVCGINPPSAWVASDVVSEFRLTPTSRQVSGAT